MSTIEYDYHVLKSRPEAYWRLDESGGTSAVDSSGNGLGASYLNTQYLKLATNPVVAGFSGSPTFSAPDGVSGAHVRRDAAELTTREAVSVEIWFYALKDQNNRSLIRCGTGSDLSYSLFLMKDGGFRYHWYDGAFKALDTETGFWTPRTKHHAVLTREADGLIINFWLDGELIHAEGAPSAPTVDASQISIGGSGSNAQFFNGQLAAAAIYHDVLTGAEIQRHYEAGTRSLNYGGVVLGDQPEGYWTLDDEPDENTAYRDEPLFHFMHEGTLTQVEVVNDSLQLQEETSGSYYTSGNRTFTLDLSDIKNAAGSYIQWAATTPKDRLGAEVTSVTIETSLDGTTWTEATSGAEIPSIDNAVWGAGGDS